MRKDKGLNGDLDRLPMLTWIMFLKFLDDMEIAEQEAQMAGKRFRPALEWPYRWRDWAAKQDGITGDELISFVNNEEAVRPDGRKPPGCSPICAGYRVPTAATDATSSPRFSKARSIG
jgi:type I restriction enzyme M protein